MILNLQIGNDRTIKNNAQNIVTTQDKSGPKNVINNFNILGSTPYAQQHLESGSLATSNIYHKYPYPSCTPRAQLTAIKQETQRDFSGTAFCHFLSLHGDKIWKKPSTSTLILLKNYGSHYDFKIFYPQHSSTGVWHHRFAARCSEHLTSCISYRLSLLSIIEKVPRRLDRDDVVWTQALLDLCFRNFFRGSSFG